MIRNKGRSYAGRQNKESFVATEGQTDFATTEVIKDSDLVFVGGQLTDQVYTGTGTNTLAFPIGLFEGDIVTIK